MYLPEVSWEDAKAQLEKTDLLIYPLGALETYGPALPLGTETFTVDHLARMVGERLGALVMPPLPLAWSMSNLGFPGAAAIKPDAIRDALVDSCLCLSEHGIRRIFFINGHGPNMFPIEEAIHTLRKQGVKGAQIDFWRFVARVSVGILDDPKDGPGHGSEMAASLMLASHPSFVRTERFQVGVAYDNLQKRFPDVLLHLPTPERGPVGHFGDPSPATAAKGEALYQRALDRVVEFIEAWR